MPRATLPAALLASLLSVSLAGAQAPGSPGSPPATRTTVNLSLEQRHIIRELVADLKLERTAVDAKVAAGDAVPQQAQLHPIPPLIGEKVPQIKSHRFFVTRQQVVLVEPKEDKVAEVIE